MDLKGFYFSLDALLASMLIVGGLLLVTQMVAHEQNTQRISYVSNDLLTSMTELRVEEMNSTTVNKMISNGEIENVNQTLLEQLGEFWALNETDNANNFSRAIVEELISEKFGMRIKVEGDEFFNKTGVDESNVVAASRMITGVKKGRAIRGSTAAAFLQRVENKRTSSFLYFGGFVGQGNVTGYVEDVPDDVNESDIKNIKLEADVLGDFDLYINDNLCDSFSPNTTSMKPDVWNLTSCKSYISSGDNKVEMRFTDALENSGIRGGFLKVKYETQEAKTSNVNGSRKYEYPGIDGVINLYDAFYIPGNLNSMTIDLHYWVDSSTSLPLFLDIGNTTVYESNESGEITQTLSSTTLESMLNYSKLSKETVPLRLGFYQGNTSNTTGNISDIFLLTSRAGTMSESDIEGTNATRMEVAKNLSHDFVEVALNWSGNRVGLASYFASSHIDQELTKDNATLHNTISSYDVQNPSQAERYLCQNIEDAESELEDVNDTRDKSMVLMTDGNATKCCSSGKCTVEKARQDSIDAACEDVSVTEITYYTIGFGKGADDEMLEKIANCSGGIFRESNNLSGLQDIYEDFAMEVGSSSIVYQFQRATEAEDVASELYTDSFIDLNFTPDVEETGPNEISIKLQTDQFNTCSPTVNIYDELRVLDARVTSYSGDHWTDLVEANGNEAYNLSYFGENYTTMGDPYTVNIPPSYLQSGNNNLRIRTGDAPNESAGCSDNNTLIYTAAVNLSSGRSGVVEEADGCEWNVEFESGNAQTFSVPESYNGSDECVYNSTQISYDDTDSYDLAVYSTLSNLDFDDDGRVFVDFTQQDLEVSATAIREVPYLWGPARVEVEMWQ